MHTPEFKTALGVGPHSPLPSPPAENTLYSHPKPQKQLPWHVSKKERLAASLAANWWVERKEGRQCQTNPSSYS